MQSSWEERSAWRGYSYASNKIREEDKKKNRKKGKIENTENEEGEKNYANKTKTDEERVTRNSGETCRQKDVVPTTQIRTQYLQDYDAETPLMYNWLQ